MATADAPFAVKKSLGIFEVLAILQNPPPNPVTNPPQKPKANQVYVFNAEGTEKQGMIIGTNKV